LTFLVTSGERVVRREELYVLVRDDKDRDEVEAKYVALYKDDGDEVFVRREWLRFVLSNDVLVRNGEDRDALGYCISYVY
jgi:hypothetical protein